MSDDIVQPYRAALLLYIKQTPALQGKCFAVKDQNQTPRNVALRVAQGYFNRAAFFGDGFQLRWPDARRAPVHQQAQWRGRHRIAIGFRPLKLLHHQPIAAQSHDIVSALRVNKSEAVRQGEKKIALHGFPARCRLNKLT